MNPDSKRSAVLALLDDGRITAGEAVSLSGVSRQLIYYWMRTENINWRKSRKERIAKDWKKYRLKELREI